ncbi:MAG: hypothetical protein M1441_00255 [Candidatus Parvarchaeota archaeon]|nr:hypothetical protein [Candidatus Parvarchaeota archaeon]
MDRKAKQLGEVQERTKQSGVRGVLKNRKFSFILGLVGGIAAIISGLVSVFGNWSIVTFNPSSISSLYNSLITSGTTNSTNLADYISLLSQGAVSLKNALLLFAPLIIIAGAFMVYSSFYLKSENRRTIKFGIAFMVIFSMFVFIGLMIYLPFNPLTISILDSYLGFNNGSNSAIAIVSYAMFLSYMILGLAAAVSKIFYIE